MVRQLDLLPPEWPIGALAALAVALVAVWLAVRRGSARLQGRFPTPCLVAFRALAAAAAMWGVAQLLARFVAYASPVPLWVVAAVTGCAVECVLAAVRREYAPLGRRGWTLAALRVAVVVLAALMFLQPTLVFYTARKIARHVAVLVDLSASMRFVDRQWTSAERLAWDAWRTGRAMATVTNGVDTAQAHWNNLPKVERESISALCETTRVALAAALLDRPREGADAAFLARLQNRYEVETFGFGRSLVPLPEASRQDGMSMTGFPVHVAESLVSATDLTGALEAVLKRIPSERLAGILLLSDGIHNADTSLLPVTRRLAAQGVVVNSVLVGGSAVPLDVALADVQAPESIFLGDKVRMTVALHASGALGKRVKLSLMTGGETVDSRELEVTREDWSSEVRFTDEPKTNGIVRYTLQVDPLEGELFESNNRWQTDVAVSDDRINVLLVDRSPRWEFRYLRNLFYGRDKSVNLQFWLVDPDRVDDAASAALPTASAARPFGEAEAGGWPADEAAWRAFDVIILGDVGPDVVTAAEQARIKACVEERGALLVLIGGPRAMPAGFASDSPIGELAPFTVTPGVKGYWQAPETSFRLVLTPSGLSHPVMAQSASVSENEAIWQGLEPFDWRLHIVAKPGSEILALAVAEGDSWEQVLTDVRHAAEHLDAVLNYRAQHALITTRQAGRGKVLGLGFDQTWRLRYKVGDTRHHRFWGQVLRWGLGDRLRAGEERFRIGTDRLVYGPDDGIHVVARLLDEAHNGIPQASLETALFAPDGREIMRSGLTPRENSHGIYEVSLAAPGEAGNYRVEVVRKGGAEDSGLPERVETSVVVASARRPIELGRTRPDPATLETLAKGTGGKVVGPDGIGTLEEAFGEGSGVVHEKREYALWCHPLLLLLIGILLTVEWCLRKRAGMA